MPRLRLVVLLVVLYSAKSSDNLFEQMMKDAIGDSDPVHSSRPAAPGPGSTGGAAIRGMFQQGSGVGKTFMEGYIQKIVNDVQSNLRRLPVQELRSGEVDGEGVGIRGSGPVGPYGYDPLNPGQSTDPWQLKGGQSDQCTSLEETWLRLCSAPPPSYLELETTTTSTTTTDSSQSIPPQRTDTHKPSTRMVSSALEHLSTPSTRASFVSFLEQSFDDSDDSGGRLFQMTSGGQKVVSPSHSHNAHTDDVTGEALRMAQVYQTQPQPNVQPPQQQQQQQFRPQQAPQPIHPPFPGHQMQQQQMQQMQQMQQQQQQQPNANANARRGSVPPRVRAAAGTRPFDFFNDLFPFAPGAFIPRALTDLQKYGTSKLREQANSLQDDSAIALSNSRGMKGGLMGMMTPANGFNYPVVMGPITRGPDYYDPTGPLGPDLPLTTSTEERCTTMMNTWLYKCNLIPF